LAPKARPTARATSLITPARGGRRRQQGNEKIRGRGCGRLRSFPSAGSTADSIPPEGGPASAEAGGSGGIKSLPETDGASLAALGSGILLATFGLIACRVATR
jgi:hypothetical protein